MNSAPGSEPPRRARSWTLSAPMSTATPSATDTATATSNGVGRSSSASGVRAARAASSRRARSSARLSVSSPPSPGNSALRRSRAPRRPRVEAPANGGRRSLGGLGVGDGAPDAHALGARLERLVDVLGGETADREEGNRSVGGGVADQLEPHGRATLLGGSLVDRADPDVVHDGGVDRVDLLGGVRGEAAQQVRQHARVGVAGAHEIQPRGCQARTALGALIDGCHGAMKSRTPAAAPRRRGRASITLMPENHPVDVVVVGGGIIGLSLAWRLCERGMSVTVLERDEAGGATSRVAAGMLAPVTEVEFGEAGRRVLELGLRSARMWPRFAAQLTEASGMEVALLQTSTLLLARDEDEARELERQLAFRQSLGLRVARLRPSAARELEPALAPTLRLALEVPDDHSVDPRVVLAALRRACQASGVQLREQTRVRAVELDASGQRAVGVLLEGGERVRAREVVLAAGPWTREIGGLPPGAGVPVRPVKGQILRLRDPEGPGLIARVLRFEGGYLLPRGDGRYVLGATMEERGFELRPTAGGV